MADPFADHALVDALGRTIGEEAVAQDVPAAELLPHKEWAAHEAHMQSPVPGGAKGGNFLAQGDRASKAVIEPFLRERIWTYV
jgi:hypothetical protein